MASVLGWLRDLDEDALRGRAAHRPAIVVPLYVVAGVVLMGGLGFVSGVHAGLWWFDDYDGAGLPYVGALLGSLAGGGLGVVLALRHRR